MAERLRQFLHGRRVRLLLAALFFHALLLPFLFFGLLHLERSGREAQFISDVHIQANLLATLLDHDPELGRIARLTDELVASGQVAYADYQLPSGEIVPSRFNPEDGRFQEDASPGEHGDHVYYLALPSHGPSGGTLRLGFSELPLERGLDTARRSILLLVGSLLSLAAGLIVFYGRQVRHAAVRLRALSRHLEGDARALPPPVGAGEIGRLTLELEDVRQTLQCRERHVAEREAYQQAVLETAAESIVTLDARGRIETFNRAAEKLFVCRADEVIGTPFAQFLAPEAIERFQTPDGRPAVVACIELGGRRRSGERCELMLSVSEGLIAGTRCFIVFVQDISERIAYEARLAHLATHDSLTGLPNRALFGDRLKQVLAHAERGGHPVAVLFLDLDRFKEINDTLGHHVGDRVLQAAARRLQGCLRSEDTLARLGGDEFVLILPQIERPTSAAVVAENIVAALVRPFPVDDRELSLSCSIGIALFPFDGKDPDQLIRHADAAMYAAKRSGGNGFRFYSQTIDAEAAGRIELESRLQHAVERDELELRFQPRVDAQNLRIVGVEALPYWRHPERGLLAPADFIRLAERSGVAAAIDRWTLAAACRQGQVWQERGWPLTVAVRLSAGHCRQASLAEDIGTALAAGGLPPGRLLLRLGAAAEGGDEGAAALREARKLGVGLELADFGGSQVSFASLKRLPVDALGIDAGLVREIGMPEPAGSLAGALIALAHGLHLKAVADGVETAEQLAYLQARGCDACQGKRFGLPLTADEMADLLSGRRDPAVAADLRGDVA